MLGSDDSTQEDENNPEEETRLQVELREERKEVKMGGRSFVWIGGIPRLRQTSCSTAAQGRREMHMM